MNPQELTADERQLIETGLATYEEVLAYRRTMAEAIAAEAEEAAEVRRWDETHCPVCGADINDPEHCR